MWREAEKEDYKIKKQNDKLRNNTIFDKSIENPTKKIDIKMMATKNQYLKWSFRLISKRQKQFCNGAIAIEKEKYRINLNKSVYIGTIILDLNKVLM